jgi:hypothetical protein
LTIALSLASREETIASSDIANTPLSATSSRMTTTSNQGNGVRGGVVGMSGALPLDGFVSAPQPYSD